MNAYKVQFVMLWICCLLGSSGMLIAQEKSNTTPEINDLIDEKVTSLMNEGGIPGMSIVWYNDGKTKSKSYGVTKSTTADPVTQKTRFQLGELILPSIATAILKLEAAGKIQLDHPLEKYFKEAQPIYEDEKQSITIRQLLYHTSGISNRLNFEKDRHKIFNQYLTAKPGESYSFSIANYVVLIDLIEKVSGERFESFMTKTVFDPLNMKGTSFQPELIKYPNATGHKVSFGTAHPEDAIGQGFVQPILSSYASISDLSVWLEAQFKQDSTALRTLLQKTHQRDATVAPKKMFSSGMGWMVNLDGTQLLSIHGKTTGFGSYAAIQKQKGVGVVVLANSNSDYTERIGQEIMLLLQDKNKRLAALDSNPGNDATYSSLTWTLVVYLSLIFCYMLWIVYGIATKKRLLTLSKTLYSSMLWCLVLTIPLAVGVYFIPSYTGYENWAFMYAWSSNSLQWFVKLFIAAIITTHCMYAFSLLFPMKNEYWGKAPQIITMGIVAGVSHVMMISMVSTVFDMNVNVYQHMGYYVLALMVFIVAKRVFEYNLIHISKGIAFDLRVKLIRKIFKTSYQNFENIDKGRVYAALNDDVNTIGVAASIFTGLAISFVTIAGIFTYLLFIQFELTMILLVSVILLAYIYQVVGKIADRYYEEARDERNVFSRLLDGMLNGFKEISVRLQGKKHYKKDLIHSADQYKNKIITANVKFLNAELLGESMVLLVLGIIAFGATKIVPNIDFFFLSSYIIVLLYLLSPIQSLLDAIPSILQVRVAWRRINAFIADIPVENQPTLKETKRVASVTSIEAHGITYEYKNEDANSEAFKIGPVNFRATSGEIVFVVGANGSGKSTLAKLLIGLYESKEGSIRINEEELHPSEIGNYFSVVFNPSYLFKKLYNLSEESYDDKKIISLLNTLGLSNKVSIDNNEYNTIELSSGQRKRLGLLQCYLEDAPIFLFDEWAADQDPHYRNFFYKTLLPELKSMGKIVIAITHDDNYFHVADRVLEMRDGTLNRYEFSEVEQPY